MGELRRIGDVLDVVLAKYEVRRMKGEGRRPKGEGRQLALFDKNPGPWTLDDEEQSRQRERRRRRAAAVGLAEINAQLRQAADEAQAAIASAAGFGR